MKLDSYAAWREAMAAITANREVLAAIGGVFFLVPSLALGLFVPEPSVPAALDSEQARRLMAGYYLTAMPYLVPIFVLQAIGTLAILTLCTDRSRPTVREAIRRGFAGFLPYFAASLLVAFAFGLVGALILAIAAISQLKALVALVAVALLLAMAYAMLRFSLLAPAIAVEGIRNPILALQRSWALTRDNAGRILLFLALIFIAFMVLTIVISMVIAGLTALVAGLEAARMASAVLSAVLGAGFTVAITAVLAAIHGQLAGPSPGSIGATFE